MRSPTPLTEQEAGELLGIFLRKVEKEMQEAGCNDLFPDEFPEWARKRFQTDFDALAALSYHPTVRALLREGKGRKM